MIATRRALATDAPYGISPAAVDSDERSLLKPSARRNGGGHDAVMKRSHIAFISFPHPPHVNPTLPIASVLVRRGHRVSYVTSDKFESRVGKLGAEFVRSPAFCSQDCSEPADSKDPLDDPFFRLSARTLEQVMALYARDPPDLVIYDFMALAGRVLAHTLNIPAIKTSPTFAHCGRNWEQQAKDPEYRRAVIEFTRLKSQFLERHGVSSDDLLFHREKLNIHLFPKAFQPDGDVFGESYFYAGRCAAEQPYYGKWRKDTSAHGPTILISTSTTHVQGSEFFKKWIEALSGLKCHLLLSIGDSGNAAVLEPLPENVEIVQHTSHVTILPYVDAFICCAGIITASEATYHGVPLVVASLGILEKEREGEIFERLGIAIHLKQGAMNLQAMKLAVIRALEDQGIRNQVRELRRIVQREPGGEETVNRIEAYLEGCSARRLRERSEG